MNLYAKCAIVVFSFAAGVLTTLYATDKPQQVIESIRTKPLWI